MYIFFNNIIKGNAQNIKGNSKNVNNRLINNKDIKDINR